MKTFWPAVIFGMGCVLLLVAFAIGWADWGEFAHRTGIVQILMGALGVVVVLLVTSGTLNTRKERWKSLLFAAVLLLGFSALTFFGVGMLVTPIGLLLFGFSIWKLFHHRKPGESPL